MLPKLEQVLLCYSSRSKLVIKGKAYSHEKHWKHACDLDWKLGEEEFICKPHSYKGKSYWRLKAHEGILDFTASIGWLNTLKN